VYGAPIKSRARHRVLPVVIRLDPVDILVFAPHPDDEVIGCAGVLQQAVAARRSVRVVFTTNGDGYPRAASVLFGKAEAALTADDFERLGETRKSEAIAAARVLGLDASNLVFMGYPDGSMEEVPAPYDRAAAQADFTWALRDSRPSRVYVTNCADEHPDHRVTCELVRHAAAETGYAGDLITFIVHSGEPLWPTPGRLFETLAGDGTTYPAGVPWPPPIRIALTAGERETKLRALKCHASQWAIDHLYLGRFVKSEEIFWLATP
jgi:LmbE family N-acetylglucosaminyl deacetylase